MELVNFGCLLATYTFDSTTGKRSAHLKNVIPPDEYVDHVDDSVYTNFVAAQALRFAVSAAVILNVECPKCDSYHTLADDLVILYDEKIGFHPEYDGYRWTKIKQADVVLLNYPLGMNLTKPQIKADLDYYAPLSDPNGPAMTWSMFTIGYLDVMDFDNASWYLNKSFSQNIHAPFNIWTEFSNSQGTKGFITAAGGFLQTIVYGYGGIRLTTKSLTLAPKCPEAVNFFKLRSIFYLGNEFSVEFFCTDTLSWFPTTIAIKVLARDTRNIHLYLSGSESLTCYRRANCCRIQHYYS